MDAWSASRYTGPRRWLIFLLVMLLLVMVQFFCLVPLLPLSEGNMSFATYFLVIILILIKGGRRMHMPTRKELRPLIWFILGIILSFIPANLYYGQSFVQSFFTYRRFFCFLSFPILLAVHPTKTELRYALYIFTMLWIVFSILVTFYMQGWVYVDEGRLLVSEGDFLHILPGGRFVCITFIFALDQYRETRHTRDLINVIIIFLCVFIMVSRTILAAALLIIVLATTGGLRTVRSRLAGLAFLIVFMGLFLHFARGQLGMLITETSAQVVDVDYNRNKALVYMFACQRNWVTVVFGNGFISGLVSTIVQDLQAQGIYNCDVGLVGMWQEYGLITVTVIFLSALKSISRDYPFLVRASGIFILVSSLTIGYFALLETTFWLCLHWYLVACEEGKVMEIRKARKTQRELRKQRYRSIAE